MTTRYKAGYVYVIIVLGLLATLTACGDNTTTSGTAATTTPATTVVATTTRATNPVATTLAAATAPAQTTAAATTSPATTSATSAATTIAGTTQAVTTAAESNPAVGRKDFTLDFDGFMAKAELTYPAQGSGPFPTVIMFAGSGTWDMDTDYTSTTGQHSANFKQTAETLAGKGYAVVRFNKRGVKGNMDVDAKITQQATLKNFIADGAKVIEASKQFEQVDPKKLFLYGWSEGGIVATHLAASRTDIYGLILHAAPAAGFKEVFTYQQQELGLPYAATFDSNKDGALSLDEIMAAFRGGAGNAFSQLSLYLFDQTSSLQNPVLSKQTDKNGDGKIDLETELKPAVASFLANFDQYAAASPDYLGFDKTIGTNAQVIGKFGGPTLLLQGQNDGFVKAQDATTLADALKTAGNNRVTLKLYPGLGHALAPVKESTADNFGPQAPAPLQDLTAWLDGLK